MWAVEAGKKQVLGIEVAYAQRGDFNPAACNQRLA
ncbi:hypothetical protein Pgy4_25655 [Pseudomonas savastanoi pv. glycinea str. race 4]|uniref:Uncharacterized protein n=1 Tax=Pseudomonas savastanoi pv. glycinea str. race 4 TaxID=875330 RepID=F3CAZ7_PSESG|nr:hypothetical protein Pgy4_25655 [Pseudomonas savastanoi pv. glycinea str. race 4]